MAIVRATGGLVAGSLTFQQPFGPVSRILKIDNLGYATAPAVGDGVHALDNLDETIGVLSAEPFIPVDDSQVPSIKITIVPDFPDDYRRHFVVLRGKVEYKRSFDHSPYSIVYESNSPTIPADDIVFYDEDIIPGVHYYYSLLVLVGSEVEAAHYEFNSNTGFATCYAYTEYGHTSKMLDLLPEEWNNEQTGDNLDFTSRFLGIFGRVFDSIKTDIDVYPFLSKNIWEIQEQQLQSLASYIGWTINRELRESVQRQEVDAASEFYQMKGREQGIRFLIQLVTGWNVEVEQGWRRTIDSNGHVFTPDADDPQAIYRVGLPWRTVEDEVIGSSAGVASQTFDLDEVFADNVIIEVFDGDDWVVWIEVPFAELNTGGDTTSQRYSVTVSGSGLTTITFADAANGAIPTAGSDNIRATYIYNGDLNYYTPEHPNGWRNSNGINFILVNAGSGVPLTNAILNKIFRIIAQKPSYVLSAVTLYPEGGAASETPLHAVDSYDEAQIAGAILRSNTVNHQSNTLGYISALGV